MRLILISSFFLTANFIFSQSTSIIVLELFTSEGCSSCPPADKLLSQVIDNADQGVEVLGLSFHVDYWDYIGWKDPYASTDYTTRQRVYGRKFQNNSIYTPQMVVNGKHEFVGSDQRKLNQAIGYEKGKAFGSSLELKDVKLSDFNLKMTVSSSDIERSILNVAIVERKLSQQVTRGENRGRTLSHDNVVRAYAFRQFDGRSNSFSIDLPKDLIIENATLIVYSQKEREWHVNAAQKIDLINVE